MIKESSLVALKQLRQQWQEDAGLGYPGEVLTQLLILYDVCKCLDLNIFQVKAVLGEVGMSTVQRYINGRVPYTIEQPAIQYFD